MAESQLYELTVIFDSQGEEADIQREFDIVQSLIEKRCKEFIGRSEWGQRDFVYPIKKRKSGYYVYYLFRAAVEAPGLISSALKMDEKVLRYLLVKTKPSSIDYLNKQKQIKEQIEKDVSEIEESKRDLEIVEEKTTENSESIVDEQIEWSCK